MLETIIVISNYFHDVATAFLFAASILMIGVWQIIKNDEDPGCSNIYIKLYKLFTRVTIASFIWIVLGGIPRFIFFKKIEWTIASDNNIIPSLVIKHIIMFSLVLTGVILWRKISRDVKRLKDR